jgi:hypothetical protein
MPWSVSVTEHLNVTLDAGSVSEAGVALAAVMVLKFVRVGPGRFVMA